jgi:diguanylate cyclase (GGDEF)-like protein
MERNEGHHPLWRVLAVLVLVVGIAGSIVGAGVSARAADERTRHRFTSAAADVLTNGRLALQREADLVTSASALVVREPDISNAAFNEWANDMHLLDRYAEILGVTLLRPVARADLGAYAVRAARDPIGPKTFDMPAEVRDEYCFITASSVQDANLAPPPGFDFCASAFGPPLLHSRDAGDGAFTAIELDGVWMLGIETPIYRGNSVPTTTAARRADFLGWVGLALRPDKVLRSALGDHTDLVMELANRGLGLKRTFRSGSIPSEHRRHAEVIDGGWVATVYGPRADGGILGNSSALALLLGGSLLSVLLAGFIFFLATARARAERLVRARTDELRYQALHDPLTGLANRTLVADRAGQLLSRGRRLGTTHAALYLDLDGFKAVNDTLGHEAGDRLLRGVAARLSGVVREADTIGRMGGDEFVVLIDGAALEAAPEMVAERILEVMRQPFEIEPGQPGVRVSTSIGIATGDRAHGDDLVRDADMAMYEAKASGKDGWVLFRPEMETAMRQGIELELELRSALDGDQFRLLYQPVYDLDDLSLISVEALLRWEHPTFGTVLPDDFLPVLERTGLIHDVGRWVLAEACRQMTAWRAQGCELSVSVNLSIRQFQSDAIASDVQAALAATGLAPSALTLEVSEAAVMRDVALSAARFEELKALGVQVAIDNFGTAYSSLAYLRQLPVDSLKIDRSFISDGVNAESQALVRTIVQLGRDLGLKTLAEGVESAEQVDQLRSDQVDEVQGFLLARPLDAAVFEAQILFGTNRPART